MVQFNSISHLPASPFPFSRTMIVFAVSFEDEMERSLARLFLQQFQVTQTKVPLTPHCEFRRPNNLTKELESIINGSYDDSMPPPVGYLSFSFFSSNVATVERRNRATELLVNFFPYIDGQVKNTKSIMLSRMRKKKQDLLPLCFTAAARHVNAKSGDNRTRYFEDVSDVLTCALRDLAGRTNDQLDGDAAAAIPSVEMGNAVKETQLIEGRQRVPRFGASDGNAMTRTEKQEQCLIESCPDSLRVSFLFKQQSLASSDPLEASILYQWIRFFQQQAEDYKILRRKPLDGYSISFLILSQHLQQLGTKAIESWIVNFCTVLDKECSDIKIQVNAQARIVTTDYFKAF